MSRLRTLLFVAKDTFRYDKYLHFIRFLLSNISTLTAPKSAQPQKCRKRPMYRRCRALGTRGFVFAKGPLRRQNGVRRERWGPCTIKTGCFWWHWTNGKGGSEASTGERLFCYICRAITRES